MRKTLRTLCILRFLCRAGGPAGEPFIQSGLFVLQEALGEKLDCGFYLDRYGPRSREILDSLLALQQEGMITMSGSSRGLVIQVTESGERFINRGGEWGAFFDVPPVRVPEDRIDTVFSLLRKGAPIDMESLGLALFLALSSGGLETLLEGLKAARGEGRIADDINDRSVIEGYRRLKKFGMRFPREEA
jgi:hypothetical protein